MEFMGSQLWEYHVREKKKRAIPRRTAESEPGIVIDRLLEETLKEVMIPAEIDGYPVNEIGKKAFMNCKQLKSVALPDTISVIREEAFSGCERLTRINLPTGLKHVMRGIFRNCTGLEEVEFPSEMLFISIEIFQGCTSLKKVKLPEKLVLLGNHTFEDCVSLETIELPGTLRKIGFGAFMNCKSLKMVQLPRSVTKISGWAFEGCSSLKEIALPEGITKIERDVFGDCSSLTRIRIPAGVINIGTDMLNWITAINVEDIGKIVQNNPLQGCNNLEEIFVYAGSYAEEWAKKIGYKDLLCVEELPVSYRICEETKTVEITELRDKTMRQLVIPGIIDGCPVTKISEEAFAFCNNLNHVVVPESVQVIGDGAFRMCYNLYSIQLPGSVTIIADTAIAGCTELKDIYVQADSYAEEWAMECGFNVIHL